MKEEEKAVLSAITIKSFVDQFGEPDEITGIFLDILMEEIFNAPFISLSTEPEQERDEISNNPESGQTNDPLQN